jgi:hypothetical protein
VEILLLIAIALFVLSLRVIAKDDGYASAQARYAKRTEALQSAAASL